MNKQQYKEAHIKCLLAQNAILKAFYDSLPIIMNKSEEIRYFDLDGNRLDEEEWNKDHYMQFREGNWFKVEFDKEGFPTHTDLDRKNPFRKVYTISKLTPPGEQSS